jgi:hypothetical protein
VHEAHHGFTPVTLDVPDTLLVHAALERPSALADRREQLRFFAYVVAPHGAARRSDVPIVEPSRGTVALTPREPGAFDGLWTLPPGAAGEERLTLRAPGGSRARAVVRVAAVAGPPATVVVSFDRPAVVAGEAEQVEVTARALDAAGNPTPAALELASELGTLGPLGDAGRGAVSARLAVPPQFGGRRELTVSARAPMAGISTARALTLLPGPPATASLSPDSGVIRADGRTTVDLELVLRDRFGNTVPGVPRVRAAHGVVARLAPDGPGRWLVTYRPAAVAERVPELVAAEAGAVRGEADLLLVPPLPPVGLLASAGVTAFGGSSVSGPRFGAGLELPMPAGWAFPPWLRGGWRLDLLGFAGTHDRGAGLLAGAVVRGEARHGPEWFGSLTVGPWLGQSSPPGQPDRSGAAGALRLAVGAGLPQRSGGPFVELGVLATGATPIAGQVAIDLSLGWRFELAREAAAAPAPRAGPTTAAPGGP